MELVIERSKYGKNRYNRRIAELLEINQVDNREWQMWKKIFTMVEWQGYWKLMKLIIGSSKCGKIRYNRRIA